MDLLARSLLPASNHPRLLRAAIQSHFFPPAFPLAGGVAHAQRLSLRPTGLVAASREIEIAVLPSHQGMGVGKEMVSRLVADSKEHKKIILYSVPGKEFFYEKLGFLRLLTAMAIFQDREWGIVRGYLSDVA